MALVIKVAKKAPAKRSNGKSFNWPMLRQDYIRENLEPGRMSGMSVLGFSQKHKIDYKTMLLHATEGGWDTLVNELREEVNAQRTRALMDDIGRTETEIRLKQARHAALAINKATLKLMSLNPDDLSIKDAIRMLQMGLTEERKALGLVESVTVVKTDANPAQEKLVATNSALAILERRRAASMAVTDVESTPVPNE